MNLYIENHPKHFWRFHDHISDSLWQTAIERAIPKLGIGTIEDIDRLLAVVLGEEQFGEDHWQLSLAKQIYYKVKPLIPRRIIQELRKVYQSNAQERISLDWPIETRYASFLWETGLQLLNLTNQDSLTFTPFWPKKKKFAFVLTHDIETSSGQSFVRQVADLEESLGFRSSFNFVPERYKIDESLIHELKKRGFEVGIHGLKHDGKLFQSQKIFLQNAEKINEYMEKYEAVGFRSPLTHRHPEWMQALNIKYDLSFFDTDPYEPIPGGTMSLWPFFLGHFVELPYTLVQDYTLTSIIGEKTPKIWMDKLKFIKDNHGMALVLSHPDYLKEKSTWDVYHEFLHFVKACGDYWHALPHRVAGWWRERRNNEISGDPSINNGSILKFNGDALSIEL